MNRRHFARALVFPALAPLALTAADTKPRAGRPTLFRAGEALIQDTFDMAPLSEKWVTSPGATKVEVEFRDGAAVLAQVGDNQGLLYQKFTTPVDSAVVDVLIKPFACKWITIGFLVADETRPFGRLLNVVFNEAGGCALHDIEKRESIKAVNTKLPSDAWRRVTFEGEGDKVVVQVNGKEVIAMKTPLIAPAKTGFAFTLYGGKAMVGDLTVSAAAKK